MCVRASECQFFFPIVFSLAGLPLSPLISLSHQIYSLEVQGLAVVCLLQKREEGNPVNYLEMQQESQSKT